MFDKKIKVLSIGIKDLDQSEGIVTFYGSAFGTTEADKDSDGDVVLKGAFAKTIKEDAGRIKHCLNHNRYEVPGVFTSLKEDKYGLLCVSQLAKGKSGQFSTLASDTLINYEAGVITEHSIGYRPTKESYDEVEGVNFISEMKLWEVSSLTAWGANQDTPVVGIKSQDDLLYQLKAIDKVVHSTNISDGGAIQLLVLAKKITMHLESLQKETTIKTDSIDLPFLTTNFKLS